VSNRWLRFVIALLALTVAGAAAYRIFQDEERLVGAENDILATDRAAASVATLAGDLRAALHAYLATGQGQNFWTARARALLDELHHSVLALDGAASTTGARLTEALDLCDRVAAAEQRAAEHVRNEQTLLASDIVFAEIPALLDTLRGHVEQARAVVGTGSTARKTRLRREQGVLGLAAVGVLALTILLLVPPGRPRERLVSTSHTMTDLEPASVPEPMVSPSEEQAADIAVPPVVMPPPTPTGEHEAMRTSLSEAASVCTDLASLSDSNQIVAALERAARVLDASGVVIWMASEDRSELFPAVSAGYDERLLARIGSVSVNAANLTARSFRETTSHTSQRVGQSAAALVTPLMTPQGVVGVLSAEVRDVSDVSSERLALATIFAAQLAMLLGSLTASTTAPIADAAPHPAGYVGAVGFD
jgi:hypothetical protein